MTFTRESHSEPENRVQNETMATSERYTIIDDVVVRISQQQENNTKSCCRHVTFRCEYK